MNTFESLLQARFPQVSEEFILKLEQLVSEELGMELDYKAIKKQREEERKALEEAAKAAISQPDITDPIKGKKPLGNVAPKGKEEKTSEL